MVHEDDVLEVPLFKLCCRIEIKMLDLVREVGGRLIFVCTNLVQGFLVVYLM
jgi:hypothetical protein